MATDVLDRVTELRKLDAQVTARRAQAEANLALARTQLEQTEKAIRALGFEPDTAEAALATLEAQLAQAVTDLEAMLRAELASCEDVIKVTTEALK